MKTATLEQLGIENVPCRFKIRYYAADDPCDVGDTWWHVHEEKPVWCATERSWIVQGELSNTYEVGGYEEGETLPAVIKGLTAEDSLFEVV